MLSYVKFPPEIVGSGLTALDSIYKDGRFEFSQLGGSCGNVLLSLAMLRWRVLPLIVLGNDETATKLTKELKMAGVDVNFVFRRNDSLSPIIIQKIISNTGKHKFEFVKNNKNGITHKFTPIEIKEVDCANNALSACKLFYTDRISSGILSAMKKAEDAGAMIFFEPSSCQSKFFEEAVKISTIVKYSSERLSHSQIRKSLNQSTIVIETRGMDGLIVQQGSNSRNCLAIPAERVTDSSGSGDMVSIGIIHWLLKHQSEYNRHDINFLLPGIEAGQKLAAANCGYLGARGFFREKGISQVKKILDRL